MTITTPALAAHHRLASSLPSRRHEWRPPPEPAAGGRPEGDLPQIRRELIRRWLSEKVSRNDMAHRLGISRTAVQKHVRIIKAERRRGNGR